MMPVAQLDLFAADKAEARPQLNGTANKLAVSDRRFHNWYRFVLSFPPHLVREYFTRFGLKKDATILDPFCGTGTTLVEAKLHSFASVGIEANPMAHFASSVKVDWQAEAEGLVKHATLIANAAQKALSSKSSLALQTLPDEATALLLKDSISPVPLHKALVLLEQIQQREDSPFQRYEKLALAKALVFSISNLHFGPEVGVQRVKKTDAPVIESWLAEVKTIAEDLRHAPIVQVPAAVHHADARQLAALIPPRSIDAVFTSPPYPNEKDYTRTTRLEAVLLGFIQNKEELRALKKGLMRSNTRNVYKGDDDETWVADHTEIQALAAEIESRRIALGKTSGFERLYGKVTKLYFGGMARHLAELRSLLKPGAQLGYVVGDQASYLQVMIRTGRLLAEIAQSLGYRVVSIDLFRKRLATATRQQLREEVVVLQWPG
jgi:16S rRNA G966 N2-methylase RsmD